MALRYGDDFKVGEKFETTAMTVTESHVVAYSGLTGDFFPLHVDAVYSAGTQFRERLVHGPLVFGITIGLVSLSGVLTESAVAWLGAERVRMLSPVKIGDTLHVIAEVLSLKTTKNPSKGVQTWRFSSINQRGETVLTFEHVIMTQLRTMARPP